MEGWVDLGDWLHSEMVYPPTPTGGHRHYTAKVAVKVLWRNVWREKACYLLDNTLRLLLFTQKNGVLPFRLIPFRLIFTVSFRITVCLGSGLGKLGLGEMGLGKMGQNPEKHIASDLLEWIFRSSGQQFVLCDLCRRPQTDFRRSSMSSWVEYQESQFHTGLHPFQRSTRTPCYLNLYCIRQQGQACSDYQHEHPRNLCCVPLGSETRISQLVLSSQKSGCSAVFRVSHLELEIRHFRLQWNDISYWFTSFRAQCNAALVPRSSVAKAYRAPQTV